MRKLRGWGRGARLSAEDPDDPGDEVPESRAGPSAPPGLRVPPARNRGVVGGPGGASGTDRGDGVVYGSGPFNINFLGPPVIP